MQIPICQLVSFRKLLIQQLFIDFYTTPALKKKKKKTLQLTYFISYANNTIVRKSRMLPRIQILRICLIVSLLYSCEGSLAYLGEGSARRAAASLCRRFGICTTCNRHRIMKTEPWAVKLHHIHGALVRSLRVMPLLTFLCCAQNSYVGFPTNTSLKGLQEVAVFPRGNLEYSNSGAVALGGATNLKPLNTSAPRPRASRGPLSSKRWQPIAPGNPVGVQTSQRGGLPTLGIFSCWEETNGLVSMEGFQPSPPRGANTDRHVRVRRRSPRPARAHPKGPS